MVETDMWRLDMNRIKIIYGLLIAVVLSLAACNGNREGQAMAAEKSTASSEYNSQYNFTTQLLGGGDVRLQDFKGKVIIVDLWDTWCPPCRMEIPHFIELHSEYQDKGFVMLGLAFGQEGQMAVEKFIEDNGINYINGFVTQDVILKLGQPQGIPTTFVFDQNGDLYKKYVGYRDKSVFEADINALLAMNI